MQCLSIFKSLSTIDELADFFNTTPDKIRDYQNITGKNQYYQLFFLAKKSGGVRVIQNPNIKLKQLQTDINRFLTHVYNGYAPLSAHGFISERSIVTNAQYHTGKAWVLNFDLENFYGSIGYKQIVNALKQPPFHASHTIAQLLAGLCTTRLGLPQGAPCSPTLSNIVAYQLDQTLATFAKSKQCTYSRYADDITFSSDVEMDKSIVVSYCTKGRAYQIGHALEQTVKRCGFNINPQKTRLQSQHQQQTVTGLKVNEKVNVNRKFIRQIRAMIHAYNTYGEAALDKFYQDYHVPHRRPMPNGDVSLRAKNYTDVIAGKLSFIKMVKGIEDPVYQKLKNSFGSMLKRIKQNQDAQGQWAKKYMKSDYT